MINSKIQESLQISCKVARLLDLAAPTRKYCHDHAAIGTFRHRYSASYAALVNEFCARLPLLLRRQTLGVTPTAL